METLSSFLRVLPESVPRLHHSAVLASVGVVSLYSLAAFAQETTTLPVVSVTSSRGPTFSVDDALLGPLGNVSILDTPYAINVVPATLIASQQLHSVREAFRFVPSVQGENIRPQTRGMQSGVVQNTRVDGLNVAATTDYPIEQFEQVEVLSGLSGALYGPANPGGTFNYVQKRPTEYDLRDVRLEYDSPGSQEAAVDLGGKFGPNGSIGYRVNLLGQNGTGYVQGSRLTRRLGSVALGFYLDPRTVVETNFATYRYTTRGFPGTFALGKNVPLPDAPDPTTVGYGQPYAGDDNITDTQSAKFSHDFGGGWSFDAGVLRQTSDRASTVPTNTLTNSHGAYTTTAATTTYSLDRIVSNTAALNGTFSTGTLKHDITLASNGFVWDRYTPTATGAITLGKASLSDPMVFPEPEWPDFAKRFRSAHTVQQSLTFGDTVHFNSAWSAMLDVSQSWIDVHNTNKHGAETSHYFATGTSPAASLIYKPRDNWTTYFTYASSLQQGDMAPSGSANAGQSLAPYRSNQYELGVKAALPSVNLTAALFQIGRPFAYVGSDNVFKVQGQQTNRGLEVSADTIIGRNLSVLTSVALLDPVLNKGGSVGGDLPIIGLPHVTANVFAQYDVPALHGFAVNANLNYMSSRPTSYTTSNSSKGFATLDLGASYASRIFGKKTTFRLTVDNVTDVHYWANIAPAGQNGYTGTDGATATLGAPRTVRFSLEAEL